MEELQERLKQEAIGLGACIEGIRSWGEPTLDDLCEKFHTYQDFCIKTDFPKLSDFDSVSQNTLIHHGIFTHGKHVITAPNRIVVLSDADVRIAVPSWGVYRVFARHNAHVHLCLGACSHVYISTFDNAIVYVEHKGNGSRLACSHFGGVIETPEYFDKINEKTV